MTESEHFVSISGLTKRFGDNEVLRDVDLTIDLHNVVCLIGASGSGKSTLLRCLNLLEPVDAGTIVIDGETVTNGKVDVNALRRRIGIVFQSFNLFPHMTVMQNITLAPQEDPGLSKHEAEAKARELLGRIGLVDKADEYPGSAFGRPAAARCDRSRARDGPEADAARRDHERARPAARRRRARPRGRAGRERHDDGDRDARDVVRARGRGQGLLPRRGSDPRGGASRRDLQLAARAADARSSWVACSKRGGCSAAVCARRRERRWRSRASSRRRSSSWA